MKTRYTIAFSALAVLLFAAGCVVTSVYPFYTEKDLVYNSSLLGDWVDANSTNASDGFARVERFGEKGYSVTIFEPNNETNTTRLYLFRLGDTLFTDQSSISRTEENLPLHQVSKVVHLSPYIETASLNYDWLTKLLEKNPKLLRHIVVRDNSNDKGRIVLNADTADLQRFLLKYLHDTNAWNEPGKFTPAALTKKRANVSDPVDKPGP